MMSEHARTLPLGPAHCLEERGRIIGFPAGEQQFRIRGQRMDHFGAQDAMLAVAGLEVAVFAERLRDDAGWQAFGEKVAIAAKPTIEDGDLATLPAKTHLVPAINPKSAQALGAFADRRLVRRGTNQRNQHGRHRR
jgi:hypothetical protein